MYKKYRDRVDFFWVYTREAHAIGSRRPARHVAIEQPTTLAERSATAKQCSAALDLPIPQLIDDMKNSVATAFQALPDRLFLLGVDQKIAFCGARGPRGFDVNALEKALTAHLASKSAVQK